MNTFTIRPRVRNFRPSINRMRNRNLNPDQVALFYSIILAFNKAFKQRPDNLQLRIVFDQYQMLHPNVRSHFRMNFPEFYSFFENDVRRYLSQLPGCDIPAWKRGRYPPMSRLGTIPFRNLSVRFRNIVGLYVQLDMNLDNMNQLNNLNSSQALTFPVGRNFNENINNRRNNINRLVRQDMMHTQERIAQLRTARNRRPVNNSTNNNSTNNNSTNNNSSVDNNVRRRLNNGQLNFNNKNAIINLVKTVSPNLGVNLLGRLPARTNTELNNMRRSIRNQNLRSLITLNNINNNIRPVAMSQAGNNVRSWVSESELKNYIMSFAPRTTRPTKIITRQPLEIKDALPLFKGNNVSNNDKKMILRILKRNVRNNN